MSTTVTTSAVEHLERANEVRFGRASLKRELAAGVIDVADAIHDKRAESMAVFDLLRCLHRYGPERVRRLLWRLMIGERRRCDQLTHRQKGLIVAEVLRCSA